jgi:hypothetical protein
MKLNSLLFIFIISIISRSAYAGEFDFDGIHLDLPIGFEEKKIEQHVTGLSTHVFIQNYGAGSKHESIVIHVQIRDFADGSFEQLKYKKDGAASLSELSLAVAVRKVFVYPKFKLLSNPRTLEISSQSAIAASVSYDGSYADRAWKDSVVNVAIYCIAEPNREIEFQIAGVSDAPNDIYSSAISAVEKAKFYAK